jgi:ABC-type glycerol-3-phosphate transport system substrate-binding protein
MRRALAVVVAMLMVLALLPATAGASGGVVINFYAHSDNQTYVDAQVAAFNALNNGITVVPHIIANDAYDDKIKVLAAGQSDTMDVLWIRTPSQLQQYVSNKALVDLSPYAKDAGLDLTPITTQIKAASDASGAFYGLPTTGSAWMLFYNKKLFDAKGLAYPTNLTWDQYMDLAKQLTYEDNGTKYYGSILPNWTMNLGASAAGEYLTADAPMPYTTKYIEALKRMYLDDKSHPGIGEMSAGSFDINALFTSGKYYMMINGDWEFQLLPKDFEYGAAPLPVFDGLPAESTVGQCSYYCVSANSKYPKEAYQFAAFCTTSAEGTKIYASNMAVPCYVTDEALAAYKESVKVPGVEYRFSAKINPEQGPETYYNDLNEAFKQEMQVALLGEQSVEDAFNNYYQLRDEILNNNK